MQWHPTGEWLAVGGWDGKVSPLRSERCGGNGADQTEQIRVLTRIGWVPVTVLECPPRITGVVVSSCD